MREIRGRLIKQKLAARYLAGGMSAKDVARNVGIPINKLRIWLGSLKFKTYVMKIEQRYLKTIDNELTTLKMSAFRVLRDAMEQDRDIKHKEWAVNKVFHVDGIRMSAEKDSKTTEVNNYIGGNAFDSPEQKEISKSLLKLYRGGKADDAESAAV